jgi:hypothetical protein
MGCGSGTVLWHVFYSLCAVGVIQYQAVNNNKFFPLIPRCCWTKDFSGQVDFSKSDNSIFLILNLFQQNP